MPGTKRCAHCREVKPLDEFSWSNRKKGIRQKQCKECMSYFGKRHYARHKAEVLARKKRRDEKHREKLRKYVWKYLKEHGCEECGERDPRVLEFDHIDPHEKRATVSEMVAGAYSMDSLKEEIGKCRVLCANCHRKKSYEDGDWWTG
jgi:hypothetical protein